MEILEASLKKNKFEARVLSRIRTPGPWNRWFFDNNLNDFMLLFALKNFSFCDFMTTSVHGESAK
jgi:hypothetical protein